MGLLPARHGLDRRAQRDNDLNPWHLKTEHRYAFPILMLRAEGRRRGGMRLGEQNARKLRGFLRRLDAENMAVHYDPHTPEGWSYVPRRDGIDHDLIRVPPRKTTLKRRSN